MKFIDEIDIMVRAGHGGAGHVSFRREKYLPNGGPDGGDGGRGGNVIIRADTRMRSLGHLRKAKLYSAHNGERGGKKKCSGSTGEDLIVAVPLGTEVINHSENRLLGDLVKDGQELIVARGGLGGRGNMHFATSVNQAPDYAQSGLPGDEVELRLNLKLFADAGLVGLPNAGKSTLLGALTRNDPKIGDYPFTTLTPGIGVVENGAGRRLLLADIPGIIADASRGAGLGLSFLRHIERVKVIIYMLDLNSMDPAADLKLLKAELSAYSTELLKRPSLIVFNKADLIDYDSSLVEEMSAKLNDDTEAEVADVIIISAREKHGLEQLVESLFKTIPGKTLAESYLEKPILLPDSAE